MSERILIPGGGGLDLSAFRHAGTSPFESWYLAGAVGAAATGSTITAVVNTFYAVPFASGRGGTLDRMAIEATSFTNVNMKLRFGIYNDSNIYPDQKVFGSAEFVGGSNGIKSENISQVLLPNKLYWFTLLTGGSGGNPVVRAPGGSNGTAYPVLGYDSGTNQAMRQALSASQSYGVLPTTFPGSPTFILTGAAFPMLIVRYSAYP